MKIFFEELWKFTSKRRKNARFSEISFLRNDFKIPLVICTRQLLFMVIWYTDMYNLTNISLSLMLNFNVAGT